jgi:hypothetical protein
VTGVAGGALVDGSARLSGDLYIPASLAGEIQFVARQIHVEPQTFLGFDIPRISISQGKIDISIQSGKVSLQALQLGPDAGTRLESNRGEDFRLRAIPTGELLLGNTWAQSTVNLKTEFGFSPKLIQSLPLIDALLSNAKQPDGDYAYLVSGALDALDIAPNIIPSHTPSITPNVTPERAPDVRGAS